VAAARDEVVCEAVPLQAFAEGVVRGMGAAPEVAAEVARHLVRSNLSGHDSHGVIRLPQYAEEADRGDLVPAARPVVVRETEAVGVVDAGRAFGHHATMFALEWAMRRAGRHGVAVVSVCRAGHIGRLGEYTERAAEAGLVGLVTIGVAGPGRGGLVPFGGRERFLGTNPWSIGVPARHGRFLIDGATSTLAEGKVRVARAKGARLPPGVVQDREGRPARTPEAYYAGGALLPLGGPVAGHKGYGLALAGALLGGLGLAGLPDPPAADGRMEGVLVLVLDPGAFGDAGAYRSLVEATLAAARRVPPAPGRTAVLVPGDPEEAARAARGAAGIAVPAATWADLGRVAERFGVPLPEARRPGRRRALRNAGARESGRGRAGGG
jgi:uncharacterized oxidoreductase